MTPRRERTIVHVDMDAFYASVELLRHPELRGKPVVVGSSGPRGVVAAASYEARRYGVFSAMASTRAQRLCPHAVFLPADHAHYAAVSAQVHEVFQRFTPFIEPLSLDEAFLDVTGAGPLFGDGPAIGAALREQVHAAVGLPCSVGVAPNKFLAKLASEAAKPRVDPSVIRPGPGVVVVAPGEELAFLHPLPVRAMWGVGPVTQQRLDRLGVRTIGDLDALGEATLVRAVGTAQGRHLAALAAAIDDRPVDVDRRPKSIGHEETFAADHHRIDTLQHELVRLGDSVAGRLRGAGVAGRTISIKVRFHDFRTITRSVTLPSAVDTGPDVVRAASELLGRIDPTPGVRLLGVHVSQLVEGAARQLSLDDVEAPSWDDATGAIDAIRARYGPGSIVPASLAGPDGIRVKKRGDQQWGPTDRTAL
jgi:DNA polymerase-4